MAKRVFQLAKELKVTSKEVLHKCRAEGLELKNHMAALSAGLEATIREWFSEEQESAHTAVEVAESVDLDEAHRKREAEDRRRRRKEGEEGYDETDAAAEGDQDEQAEESSDQDQPQPQVEAAESEVESAGQAEPQAQADQVESSDQPEVAAEPVAEVETELQPEASAEAEVQVQAADQEVSDQDASVEPAAEQAVVEDQPQVESEAEPESEAPAEVAASDEKSEDDGEVQPEGKQNKPKKPKDVAPAGPQLIPKPAQLQGPKVVRVEQPDYIPAPRRRPRDNDMVQGDSLGGPAAARAPQFREGTGGPPPAGGPGGDDRNKKSRRRNSPRRRGRGSDVDRIKEWRDRDLAERRDRLAAAGKGIRRQRAGNKQNNVPLALQQGGPVEIEEPITIKSLSAATGLKSADLIKKLMSQGIFATVTQTVSTEQAEALALEFEIELKVKRRKTSKELLDERFEQVAEQADSEKASARPPIVTFLGHVDHGKTSLMDAIRQARVVDTESGGITQHIGSYRYEKDGLVVAFLDTPGHEAFTHMRARGANMTDIVVLVVAADDGVMPQTIEAINHAKAAEVPIVVALNKIDVPNANVNRVMGQLAEHGLQPRQWGGETEVVETSAIKGDGIDDLIELLSLEAEMLELTADADQPASGAVIEAEMAPGRGVVARLLVQDGTLRVGDTIVAGVAYGRVRQILNDRGQEIESAGPSTPVEVAGFDGAPSAGDKFYEAKDISEAKNIAEEIRADQREMELASKSQITLDNLFSHISSGEVSELPLIVKADVQGSVEVLNDSLNKLSTDEVRLKILHSAVGGVTNSDVLLAEASGAIIVGFHVIADATVREQADRLGVDIRLYRVIYELIDEVTQAMTGLLTPDKKEEVLGHAEVRDVFKVSKVGAIAGCYVTDGIVARNSLIRVTRGGIVIEEDRVLDSLKRFKDDAREVRAGMECGMKIEGYNDIKQGDVLEAYKIIEVAREL